MSDANALQELIDRAAIGRDQLALYPVAAFDPGLARQRLFDGQRCGPCF